MKEAKPSRLFLRFFQLFCDPRLVEDIEGDLLERFEIRVRKKGQRKARWLFIRDVLQLFKPGIIRNFSGIQKLNNYDMFKNYFKTARRNLLRHKVYSTIKIGGFAIGIAVCILISLFIKDELSYNQHIKDQEQIFMVVKEFHEDGDINKYTWFAPPFAQSMKDEFPEVELAGRMLFGFGAGDANLRKAGEITNYYEDGFAYADPSVMEIFDFPMVYGDLKTALSEPQSMVITKSKAELLYPGINPIGEVVYIDDNTDKPYKIAGVMEDLPENSTVKFNYLWSLKNRELWPNEQQSWGSSNYQVFVKLRADANAADLGERIKKLDEKYYLPMLKKSGIADAEAFVNTIHYSLLSMGDIHLYSADVEDPFTKSDIKYVIIFGLIASFILGLACINFINLSTAKSANRAKEVGLRKTIGSGRGQLVTQFLAESVLYSGLSFVFALGLSSLLLPYFNQLAHKSIAMPWTNVWFLIIILVSAVLIGLLAGLYPAFYLSGFKPAAVLKGKLARGSKGSGLRNTLVVVQFTASIILIIGTFVVYNQMEYILNQKVGFDKEQVLVLQSPYLLGDNIQNFKNELETMPTIESISFTGYLPISRTMRNGNTWWKDGRTKLDPATNGQNWMVDYDYINTLGMKLVAGRNFDKDIKSDSAGLIINQSFAKAFNIEDNPIGQRITNRSSNSFTYTVIGVVEDFHFESFTQELSPLAMTLAQNYSTATIKLSTTDLAATLKQVEETWAGMAPGQPFISDFLDRQFKEMYVGVTRIRNILTAFAVLAVIIACLGLFGLSVFMVEQRGKEISVRLALGAKTQQIVTLLSTSFMKPILLAMILATPIAWYVMKEWLAGFEYNAGLSITLFVWASASALLIALITISFQSVKAALTSPVQGLRNE